MSIAGGGAMVGSKNESSQGYRNVKIPVMQVQRDTEVSRNVVLEATVMIEKNYV